MHHSSVAQWRCSDNQTLTVVSADARGWCQNNTLKNTLILCFRFFSHLVIFFPDVKTEIELVLSVLQRHFEEGCRRHDRVRLHAHCWFCRSRLRFTCQTNTDSSKWDLTQLMFPTCRASLGGFWEEQGNSWLALCATWWASTSSVSPLVFRSCLLPRWGSWVRINGQTLQFSHLPDILFVFNTVAYFPSGLWTGLTICVLMQSIFFITFLYKLDWRKAAEEVRTCIFRLIQCALLKEIVF